MLQPGMIEVKYTIASGYYLYQEKLKFSADGAKLGTPVIPKGKVKFDETFQKDSRDFPNSVNSENTGSGWVWFVLHIGRQGCADQGLCYPPLDTEIKLTPPVASIPVKPAAEVLTAATSSVPATNQVTINPETNIQSVTAGEQMSGSNASASSSEIAASVPAQASENVDLIDTDAKTMLLLQPLNQKPAVSVQHWKAVN